MFYLESTAGIMCTNGFNGSDLLLISFLEVYIDEGKKTYKDLNYKRFNLLNIWTALLSRISRAAISESRGRGIRGNLSGDGLQNGGLLIVTKMGMRVLMNHREEVPGDHVANDDILKVLGITEVKPSKYVKEF